MMPKWLVVFLLGAVMLLGSVGGAMRVEHHDAACGACHTAPEVTYLERRELALQGAVPHDLASAHFAAETHFDCIDCHNGDGLPLQRVETLTVGAEDILTTLRGEADPTLEKGSVRRPHLVEQGCTSCHLADLLEPGFDNHHHHMLEVTYEAWLYPGAQREIAQDDPELYLILQNDGLNTIETPERIQCMSCHTGHIGETAATAYLDVAHIEETTCNACHLREGARNELEVLDGDD